MNERNSRFGQALIAYLERKPGEWINEVGAYRAPTQVLWDRSTAVQHAANVWLDDHARSARGAGLGLVDLLVSLYHRCQDVFVVFQDLEDCGLVHWLEWHRLEVYLNGGLDGLPSQY